MAKFGSVLVTGGAGFIGSHVVDLLLQEGYRVTIIDSLDPQVHGLERKIPAYLDKSSSIVVDDVRNKKQLAIALRNVDAIIHLAATVGVGQSMYQIERYVDSNTRGTAVLLDLLVNREHGVSKLVVASSMSVYGEGKYYCDNCNSFQTPRLREIDPKSRDWDHHCETCKGPLKPVPTDEETHLRPTSLYAMSKRHQEEMSLLIGRTYGLPTIALRFFNVYGPRQALSNPYSGAMTIFLNRILNGKQPHIFEDGNQLRDFIHVKEIARSCLLALTRHEADYSAINIGTGNPTSILQVANSLIQICKADLRPSVSNQFRRGDIRHCYADVRKARELLGFQSNVTLLTALSELVDWAKVDVIRGSDVFEKALKELQEKRLA